MGVDTLHALMRFGNAVIVTEPVLAAKVAADAADGTFQA